MANALMLGGGAPTLTLESGALAALLDREIKFDVVSTAGAGMLVGLLYTAPLGITPREALERTKEMGVHDAIYDKLPVNFKVFHKPGPMADAYRRFLQQLPRIDPLQIGRYWSDLATLFLSSISPSNLSSKSLGLCEHAPWIEEVVDFDKLRAFPGEFYMNAYCIEDQAMRIFSKHEITPEHFRAALAFPLIYPPFEFEGKTYLEGSAIDTLCFDGLLQYRQERLRRETEGVDEADRRLAVLEPIRTVVLFDVLSARRIIRKPTSLYDAWVQSIMVPLVKIAGDNLALFQHVYNRQWKLNVLKIEFEIPDSQWPHVLDWSYSNLSTLFDVGYKAGQRFCDQHAEALAHHEPKVVPFEWLPPTPSQGQWS